ncbi:hypothetical protein [Cupriavidus necator]|nr:hypothetical protein [Cupriavidus necator]MDX6012851.1 hypothetical protein [Cupriavidus necator]
MPMVRALAQPHQDLSVIKHLEPSVHALFRLKARRVVVNEGSMAPLRRRSAGAFMPKIRRRANTPVISWRHYAEALVAALRRRRLVSIMPAIQIGCVSIRLP